MKHPDEIILFEAVRKRGPYKTEPTVRQIIAEIGMNEKRAANILGKWTNQQW